MSIYDTLEADEFEYSPFGVQTGLCVGVGATPANGTRVDLEPCGVSAKTVWIIDSPAVTGPAAADQRGDRQQLLRPLVLSALGQGCRCSPRRCTPRAASTVFTNQLWGSKTGVVR